MARDRSLLYASAVVTASGPLRQRRPGAGLVLRFAFSFPYLYLSGWHAAGNRPVVHSAILAERPATLVIILMTRPFLSALKFGA